MATLKELRNERIKKLNKLIELGIDPFPPHSKKDAANAEIINNFEKFNEKVVNITGRIMSFREHGPLVFIDLHDFSGKIQLYIKDDTLKANEHEISFENLKLLDIGDFIQAKGKVVKTQSGEISLAPTSIKLLTKSIRPLPNKKEGLKDKNTIFRRRYLDLAMNPEIRERFVRKSKFWDETKTFLKNEGFIELETPVLEHTTGGADAKPFVTHHEALDESFYLRISSELPQKRLIGGGFEKIYVFGPNFRNEGIDDEHLQEFSDIEWYWAYADYKNNMKLIERMFKHVAQEVFGTTKFTRGKHEFDLAAEWEKIDYAEVIKERFDVDVFETPDEKMLEILKQNNVELPGAINRLRLIDNLWKVIRKDIAGPAFLINHPKFISPLAKSLPDNDKLTERFQVIIAGSELGNGYSELNDPFDQLERFKEQQSARDSGDDEAQMMDIDYVEMLEYGMPPTSGYGQSERVFWFLEGVTAREGVFFPQMRRHIEDTTKEIYELKTEKKVKSKKEEEKEYELPQKNVEFNIEDALKLLETVVKDDYQIMHAHMVAEAMKAYAQKLGEYDELWYLAGLLHDIDYYPLPEVHPAAELQWFKKWNFPEEFIHAVDAHAHCINGTKPRTKMAAALIAIDELAGFLYAYSLMRPEGFEGMKPKSIKKKFKDKAFARKIDREEIMFGVKEFGVDFSEHIQFMIDVYSKMDELPVAYATGFLG